MVDNDAMPKHKAKASGINEILKGEPHESSNSRCFSDWHFYPT